MKTYIVRDYVNLKDYVKMKLDITESDIQIKKLTNDLVEKDFKFMTQ